MCHKFFLYYILLSIFCAPSFSDDLSWNEVLVSEKTNFLERRSREVVAIGLKNKIDLIESKIMTDENEKKFIDIANRIDSLKNKIGKEDNGKIAEKYSALMADPYFNFYRFSTILNEIKISLNCTLSEEDSVKHEISCWAAINYYLLSSENVSELISDIENKNQLILSDKERKDFLFFDKNDNWLVYRSYAGSIQKNIIIPFLEN